MNRHLFVISYGQKWRIFSFFSFLMGRKDESELFAISDGKKVWIYCFFSFLTGRSHESVLFGISYGQKVWIYCIFLISYGQKAWICIFLPFLRSHISAIFQKKCTSFVFSVPKWWRMCFFRGKQLILLLINHTLHPEYLYVYKCKETFCCLVCIFIINDEPF